MKKRALLTTVMLAVMCASYADGGKHGSIVEAGMGLDNVSKQMLQKGYKTTELSMVAAEKTDDIRIWKVGGGYLIVNYSLHTRKINSISFLLVGKGPKSTRSTFSLKVRSFDTVTEELTIQLKE